ncbi:MAG: UDP-N-acetylmuramoyl-L-alanine--D-glutamate ligase [bacterium]
MPEAITFIYKSYKFELEKREIFFNYEVEFEGGEMIKFTDKVILPEGKDEAASRFCDCEAFNSLLETLHIILGVSYYKLYLPPKIKLSNPLSKDKAEFFNTVYRKGLGEFCYRNKIDPERIAKFPFTVKRGLTPFKGIRPQRDNSANKILLGIAGGKDSIVAGELLKQQGEDITGFVVDTHDNMHISEKIAEIMGVKILKLRHILDEKIYQNLPGSYKGHIPFSAIVGSLGTLLAYLYGYKYVAVANEYSANFGNIKYKGEEVNHQWSKTSEFENLFQSHIEKFITPEIKYFSVLRQFYELRIAEMFAKYKKYFPHFTSCNENFKRHSSLYKKDVCDIATPANTNTTSPNPSLSRRGNTSLWCGKCPKCVFVFTMLSAFLPKSELLSIFGKNLYDDEKLIPVFRDLLGTGKLKPFDCVGTFEEMRVAFMMARKKYKDKVVMKEFSEELNRNFPFLQEKNQVFKTQPAPNLPEEFKFLGIKNVLILGYGKEGRAVHEYLKNKYPKIKMGIADQKNDKNYLKKQENFDLVIKSPGIPKKLVRRPYTTPTNIFFARLSEIGESRIQRSRKCIQESRIHKSHPITIGITGSKGKSTTSSLIYSIFKEAGFNTELIGNIGKPMLEALSKPIKKDTFFVIEMSSYQLDDIRFSPDIANILNLFPDHMPYHNGIENYYNAKKNIIKFQKKDGIFIYNSKERLLKNWAKKVNGKAIAYDVNHGFCVKCGMTNLMGEHNLENIKAAITVAKLFDISDEIIEKAIRNFKPLPHRLEFVGEFKGIRFYNDSISTTPESAIAAIEAFSVSPPSEGGVREGNPISTLLLGGEDRGYDFKNLEKIIKKYKIKNIVLFPDTGKRIFKSKKDRKGLNILETSLMKEALKFAYKYSPKKSICLLSPASPSHNLWNNFEERGEEFSKWVRKIHLNYNSPNSSNKMANVQCQIL